VRASTAAGAGRGRVGLVGELVELLLCTGKGKKRAGRYLLTMRKESGEFTDEEEAAAIKFDDGRSRRSGVIGAQLLRTSGT
jgi:hypothetical protein